MSLHTHIDAQRLARTTPAHSPVETLPFIRSHTPAQTPNPPSHKRYDSLACTHGKNILKGTLTVTCTRFHPRINLREPPPPTQPIPLRALTHVG